jgi:mono/diheme cytochrome c family protein
LPISLPKERFNTVGTSRSLQPWIVALASTSLASALTLAAAPQAAPQGAAGLEAPSGAALYAERCASCHGATATGNGPMSRALKHAPPDLTSLSIKNHGMFPSARVYRIIEGRDVDSHGDREMPVWGEVVKAHGDRSSRDATQTRIEAIVKFLESIQRRQA